MASGTLVGTLGRQEPGGEGSIPSGAAMVDSFAHPVLIVYAGGSHET